MTDVQLSSDIEKLKDLISEGVDKDQEDKIYEIICQIIQ